MTQSAIRTQENTYYDDFVIVVRQTVFGDALPRSRASGHGQSRRNRSVSVGYFRRR